ncbi:MFS transporter [Niveispirillum fermenti]|uniref:MFS transporter n=1 Tax=Niveispirillum fermenti TaxID=1233113 RepID=UPI003A863DCF
MISATGTAGSGGTTDSGKELSSSGRWLSVVILGMLYFVAMLDRQILALLIPPIKADLGLTDVQVSLLQGVAFALFYVLAAIPIGWAVDRYSRRMIIWVGVTFWSIAATCCGLAQSFWQLFAARAGVGAGEASLTPATFAIMADLFPPSRLSTALSVFVIGGTVGTGLAFLVGGPLVGMLLDAGARTLPLLGEVKAWQLVFIITGVPGMLLAFLVFLLPETRTRSLPLSATDMTEPGFGALFRHMRPHARFYLAHNLGFALVQAGIVAIQMWTPTFLSRIHGWSLKDAGLWLGVAQIVAPLLGLMTHGWIVDRMFRRGILDAHLRWFRVLSLCAAPLLAAAYLAPAGWMTILGFGLVYFLTISCASIGPAALQIATPRPLRGRASALYVLATGLVGAAGGPFIVAAMTDYVFGDETRLGPAIACAGILLMLSASLLFTSGLGAMRRAVAAAGNG